MQLKKKSWSVEDILQQIHALSRECSSPYNEGFTAFECKKDLYQIKAVIDDALRKSPDFGNYEKEWLQQQEQKRIIKILKD